MLALLDALLKTAADAGVSRSEVEHELTAAIRATARKVGIADYELDGKASELCEYGGPVIYYP